MKMTDECREQSKGRTGRGNQSEHQSGRGYRRGFKYLIAVLAVLLLAGLTSGCVEFSEISEGEFDSEETWEETEEMTEETAAPSGFGSLSSTEDIGLYNIDGVNYGFTYRGEEFRASYYYDNWTIYDSYKITKRKDMKIICQALIDVNPVHGKDLESYRTAKDMAYEWRQHNLAYKYLPEGNAWRENAKNVDFDPADQGRSFEEIYEDRTGRDFDTDVEQYVKEKLDDGGLAEKLKEMLR